MNDMNMNVIGLLQKGLAGLPDAEYVIHKLTERYGNEVTLQQAQYWLDESTYFLAGWRKKHLDAGEDEKAAQEETKLQAIAKALELIRPYIQPEPMTNGGL